MELETNHLTHLLNSDAYFKALEERTRVIHEQVVGKENELLEAFAKAVLASYSNDGYSAKWLARNVEMVRQHIWEDGGHKVRWYFRVKE